MRRALASQDRPQELTRPSPVAVLEKAELPAFPEGPCGPQEYSEAGDHRRNRGEDMGNAGGPEDFWLEPSLLMAV